MRERFRLLRANFKNALSLVGDIVFLNLLFLVCSIPIITIGAATTACYAGVSRTLQKKETGLVYRAFFADFRAAFKQATAGWLMQIGVLLILAGDIWFATVYSDPNSTFFLIFAVVMIALLLLGAMWFYPLVARFRNPLGTQIKNSFLLAFAQFPRTVLALLIWLLVLGIPFLAFDLFMYFGWFWLACGFSLPMYWTVKLFRKTLQLDKTQEEVSLED